MLFMNMQNWLWQICA